MPQPVDVALELATTRRWSVFKLQPLGKAPATPHGHLTATTGPKRIRAMFATQPDANVGIACGASELVVVDCDYKPDLGVNGLRTFLDLAYYEHDDVTAPYTYTVVTPHGGRHFYYRAPDEVTIGNSVELLGPGVDVRATGGYVVAEGSVTDAGVYERELPFLDDDDQPLPPITEPAPLPDWLTELLTRPVAAVYARPAYDVVSAVHDADAYGFAALEAEARAVANATEGTRNDTLNRAAHGLARLVPDTLDAETIGRVLCAAALEAGLPEREAVATIRSALRARGST